MREEAARSRSAHYLPQTLAGRKSPLSAQAPLSALPRNWGAPF